MTKKHYYRCTIVIYTRVNGCENKFAISAPTFQSNIALCDNSKVIKKYVRKNIFPDYIIEGAYTFAVKNLTKISESVALSCEQQWNWKIVKI